MTTVSYSNPCRVHLRPLRELDHPLEQRWQAFREMAPHLKSPFFSIPFCRAVAEVRPDVSLAVFEDDDEVVGILPFQEAGKRIISPVGGQVNDLHGIIGSAQRRWNITQALQSIGRAGFEFHALAHPIPCFEPYFFGTTRSFLADLAAHPEGYVEYLEKKRATIYKQRKKTRQMVRALGPLRLEWDCRDPAVLDRVIHLKRQQYARTYIFDLMSVAWIRNLLEVLFRSPDPACRGILSVLYAGDKLVAGHYGIIEGPLLHYWFPVYDPAYHPYSPGTALFLEICRQAATMGITKIDFGYGEQPYKEKLTDTISHVHFGRVDPSPWRWWQRRCTSWIDERRHRLPFKERLKPIVRRLMPQLDAWRYT